MFVQRGTKFCIISLERLGSTHYKKIIPFQVEPLMPKTLSNDSLEPVTHDRSFGTFFGNSQSQSCRFILVNPCQDCKKRIGVTFGFFVDVLEVNWVK